MKVRINKISKNVAELIFDRKLRGYPGQFVMLNVFGYEEIPLSLSSQNTLTVKAVGETTKFLVFYEDFSEKKYIEVGVRGPFGRPFSLPKFGSKEKALLIAGGIGIAPLNYMYLWLKKYNIKVSIIHGLKTSGDLVYKYPEMFVATEDGSLGYKGNAVELAEKLLDKLDLENLKIYVCGPLLMMKGIYKVLKKYGVLDKSEFSMENYMRCGIGVCGSCVIGNGLRVCRDGPVFRGAELSGIF